MKVLVTGGSGQVGGEILRRAGQWPRLQLVAPTRRAFDLTQPSAMVDFLQQAQPDAVIHCAAYTAVDQAELEPHVASEVNATAVAVLAREAKRQSFPVIHLSTDYVFDGALDRPYREDDVPEPTSVYGSTKLAGEQALLASGAEVLVLRVSWVFSSLGKNFLKTMLRLGAEREQLSVVVDQLGAPTYAGDIAELCLSLCERLASGDATPCELFHYSGTPDTTWHEFASVIFNEAVSSGLLAGAPSLTAITTDQYPTRASRPSNSRLDCLKIEQVLGVRRPSWHLGIQQALSLLPKE